MKIGPLLKCILNQDFLARLTFTFFILLFGGPKGPPNKSVFPKILVQIQYLSEYNWAEEVGGGGKGQGGPGRLGGP